MQQNNFCQETIIMKEETNVAKSPDISSESFTTRMLYNMIRTKFPRVCQLSIETLKKWLADNETSNTVLLLDVRETSERSVSYIPNSVHVLPSETNFSFICDEIKNSHKSKIVAFCSVGYRSSMLAQKIYGQLKKNIDVNVDNVEIYNLEGSIFKWANEGNDLVDSLGQSTAFVHPYNTVWGRFLDAERRKYPSSL